MKNYSIYIPDYKAISRNIERQKVRKELNLPMKTIFKYFYFKLRVENELNNIVFYVRQMTPLVKEKEKL